MYLKRDYALDADYVKRAARILKCLGHPMRIAIVSLLGKREMNVGDLQGEMGIPQSIVSQQLSILKKGEIVLCRREKNSMYYYLRDKRILGFLSCLNKCSNRINEGV